MNLAQHINLSVDRWPSGRRRSPAKGVGGKLPRGFESLPVRHTKRKHISCIGLVWGNICLKPEVKNSLM